MNQNFQSRSQQQFEGFLQQQEDLFEQQLRGIEQALFASWQRSPSAWVVEPTMPVEPRRWSELDQTKIIEGEWVVIHDATPGSFKQGLAQIEARQRAVSWRDWYMVSALAMAMASLYYTAPWLALAFDSLAWLWFYRKWVRAAHAPCPRCWQPFGNARRWPLRFRSCFCQHCGLPLKPTAQKQEGSRW